MSLKLRAPMIVLTLGICTFLMADVIAQTGSCSGVCPAGSNLTLPDELIYNFNDTCGEVDQYVKANIVNVTQCEAYQNYAPICGCTGFKPSCSGVCPLGSNLTLPYEPLYSYDLICGEWDQYIKRKIDNVTECVEFQSDAPICGCTGSEPLCPGLCSNGGTVLFPDKIIPDLDLSCEYIDDFVKAANFNETSCSGIRDNLNDFCGCPASTAITPAPSGVLTLSPIGAPVAAPTSPATTVAVPTSPAPTDTIPTIPAPTVAVPTSPAPTVAVPTGTTPTAIASTGTTPTTSSPVSLSLPSVSSSPVIATLVSPSSVKPSPGSVKPTQASSSSVCLNQWITLYLLSASTCTFFMTHFF